MCCDSLLILNKYPRLLPRSSGHIWEGFLYPGLCNAKIRIDVPNYPLLKGVSVFCPPSLKNEFCRLPVLDTFPCLLSLIDTISTVLPFTTANVHNQLPESLDRILSIQDDFNKIGNKYIIEVHSEFEGTVLAYQDIHSHVHKMRVSIPQVYGQSALVISEVDLPVEVLPQLRRFKRISDLFETFKGVIDSLVPFWEMCNQLEEETWVVDPQMPKKEDTHRRIHLNNKVSVVVTLNPTDLDSPPQIQFMGSVQAVAEARDQYQSRFRLVGWDTGLNVLDNLLSLLVIERFPKKPRPAASLEGILQDCFICFSNIVDKEPPPSKWCPNDKCSSIYHLSCLLKWLESVPTSKLGFDHISGSCPYCNEKVMCPINKS